MLTEPPLFSSKASQVTYTRLDICDSVNVQAAVSLPPLFTVTLAASRQVVQLVKVTVPARSSELRRGVVSARMAVLPLAITTSSPAAGTRSAAAPPIVQFAVSVHSPLVEEKVRVSEKSEK